MTGPIGTMSIVAQAVALSLLTVTLLLEAGCVSRRTYEQVKAETLEQTRTLEAVRADLRKLDREIAELQAANRRDEATVSELRAAVQREEEQLPMMRQRAEDTLALLKTQVATLMNQSWDLARKIVDIRQESVSLQTKVAHYKKEMEQSRSSTLVTSGPTSPSLAQAAIEPSPSTVPTNSGVASAQLDQIDPTPPSPPPVAPAAPSPSVKVEPASTNDDSWIGMITSWFSKIWNWLFG